MLFLPPLSIFKPNLYPSISILRMYLLGQIVIEWTLVVNSKPVEDLVNTRPVLSGDEILAL